MIYTAEIAERDIVLLQVFKLVEIISYTGIGKLEYFAEKVLDLVILGVFGMGGQELECFGKTKAFPNTLVQVH